jgi:hypothetical protein
MLHARLTRTSESVLVEMPFWAVLSLSTGLGQLADRLSWHQAPGDQRICRVPLPLAREIAQIHSIPSGINHAFRLASEDTHP